MATNNYQNGKIYTIRSNQTVKYYIGSTAQKTLAQRLGKHRSNYNDYMNGKGHFRYVFEILKYNDYYIELLELTPCNSKIELERREGQLQRQYKSEIVNNNIAGQTVIEYKETHKEEIKANQQVYNETHKEQIKAKTQAYNETHKERIKANHQAYNETHKEQIKAQTQAYRERRKEIINCECGSSITTNNKTKHDTTKKHLNYIKQTLTSNNETLPIIELAELLII